MDPLTSLVTALAAGAAAALQSTVEQGVKDSYAALKWLIQRKYAQVDVNQLEANPSSKSRQGVVEEDLKAVGADQDAEVLQHAQALLEVIQRQVPEVAAAIGVDLKEIEGASLAIRHVIAAGAGVKVERAKLSGDITIEDVNDNGRYRSPRLSGPPNIVLTKAEFEVPIAGFSANGQMYVFHSTSHFVDGGKDYMSRMVLMRAQSGDPTDLHWLYDFSVLAAGGRFLNVACTVWSSTVPGLPFAGPALLAWGSGRHRNAVA